MKGTFFSADFIKDANNQLRLLELNTDTVVVDAQLSNIDWQPLIDVMSANSTTEIHVVYKPIMHAKLIDNFVAALGNSSLSNASITLYDEDLNTVYPNSPEDGAGKFILRLAYDESALFDSSYCKNRLEVYKLFWPHNTGDVAQFYYSSSIDLYNTLDYKINTFNIPDATVKDIYESSSPIDFYKIGHSELLDEERWEAFILENKAEDKLIEQYHFHSSSLDENSHITSYRTFFVVYGSALDTVNVLSYKNTAIFDAPSDLGSEVHDSVYSNRLEDKHYYEFTTNAFKVDGNGLLSTDKIQMSDESFKALGDIQVGDSIKSYFISGSPQVENDLNTMNWSHSGSTFPSGSYVTSSDVVFKNVEQLHYNGLVEYVVGSESLFSGTSKQFLVYDSSSDSTTYKHASLLDSDTDYFYDLNGNLIDLDQVNYYVTSDNNLEIVELDVEDTDTYIISGSTAFNGVVSHNAPCFAAGTLITLADGTKTAIENIQIGDSIKTFSFGKNVIENRKVQGVTQKMESKTIQLTMSDGTTIRSTFDHPFFNPVRGWVSGDPAFTKKKYGLTCSDLQIGELIQNYDGNVTTVADIVILTDKIKVYNLVSVEVNHNYYANDLLVHNRCFVEGTKINLPDGSTKNIEDFEIGDEVLSCSAEGKQTTGVVNGLSKSKVPSIIRLTLDNEIIIKTTSEHPFLVEDKGWVKAGHLESLDVCKKADGSSALVSTVEVLKEETIVYNLLDVTEDHTFYANGILVHNK